MKYHTEATSVVTKKGHVKTAPGSRSLHSREAAVYLELWIALASLARFFFGDYFDIQIVEIVLKFLVTLIFKVKTTAGTRSLRSHEGTHFEL